MSQYNSRHDIKALLEAAQLWKDHCLLADGPLLGDGKYWSSDKLAELDQRFIQNPQEGDESYFDKLALQLTDASPEAIKLMAELNWLLLLFSTNIKPGTKRDLVRNIWELSGDALPQSWLLEDATLSGAGSTGTAYNTLRWRELVFLIELMKAFKALEPEAQNKILATPWSFADWLENIPDARARQFRHIICFLLFPDHFESISVGSDKREIARVLGDLPKAKLKAMSNREVDETLLQIRTQLEEQQGQGIDFYSSPWIDQWRPSPRAWLLAWNPDNRQWQSFQDDRLRVARGENVTLPWRAVSGQLKEGDTAYLVRLGEEPQGLVARGTVTSEPYEDAQYDPDLADKGEKALYVDITLTDLRDPKAEPYISLADLKAGTVDGQDWTPQGSGIEIKPRSAKLVAGLWSKLPPVRVVQANQPTSRQQAIHIGKPVNQIFYGPPGTGKTHHWRNHIQPKYEQAASPPVLQLRGLCGRHPPANHRRWWYQL